MNRISPNIFREEQAGFANTWTATSGYYWDEAALAKASPLTSVLPKRCSYYVSLMTKAEAWSTEDISAISHLSNFSVTLDDSFVVLRKRAIVQDKIEDTVFEWSQHETIAIPDEIVQAYFTAVPHRTLFSYSNLLPTKARPRYLLTRMLHKAPIKTEAEEKTEIEFEQIPREVFREIERWGLKNQVFTTLRLIRETYLGWRMSNVSISTDPEIPERRRIRITITVSGTPEDVFQDELRFKERLYSTLDIKVCELITVTYNWET